MSTNGEKVEELVDFLSKSFNLPDFQMFLRLKGYEEVFEAVNPDVGAFRYFFDVVHALDHRGLIDGRFFAHLKEARPKKDSLIVKIEASWVPDRQERPWALPFDTMRAVSARMYLVAGFGMAILIILSILYSVYIFTQRPRQGANASSPPARDFTWVKLQLGDAESPPTRQIAQYRFIVDWLSDSAMTDDSQRKGQSEATHMLYLGSTPPLRQGLARGTLWVRTAPIPIKNQTEWIKIAALPVIRRDDFIRVEGLLPGSGRPSSSVSALAIEKTFTLERLREGDALEVVVVVKASTSALFERIEGYRYDQLFTAGLELSGDVR
jgi:hypothetical protein